MRPNQLCLGCITDRYPTELAKTLSEAMKERLNQGAVEEGRIYESH